MRATLVFNLPEEQQEFDTAQSGEALARSLDEIAAAIRARTKYGTHVSKRELQTLEELRALIDFDALERAGR